MSEKMRSFMRGFRFQVSGFRCQVSARPGTEKCLVALEPETWHLLFAFACTWNLKPNTCIRAFTSGGVSLCYDELYEPFRGATAPMDAPLGSRALCGFRFGGGARQRNLARLGICALFRSRDRT